ncbi:DUF4192 domain-containing protein, partial [Streptomyces sp. NPDC006658]
GPGAGPAAGPGPDAEPVDQDAPADRTHEPRDGDDEPRDSVPPRDFPPRGAVRAEVTAPAPTTP